MGIADVKITIAGVDKFSKTLGKSMKGLNKLGKKVGSVGKKMTTGLTLPIVAFGGLALRTTAKFQFAMNKVQAKTGAVGEDFKKLGNLSKKLGKTTMFSAVEAAEGMDFLAMAGFKTNDILTALPGTLNLAAASSIGLADAADISSNILTAYGMKTSKLGYLNDVMAQAMASANFNMLEIGESMTYASGISRTMGVDVMETTKILGLLANSGIKGGRAGVVLANVMSRLAAPSEKAIEILKAKGLKKSDLFTADGKFKDLTGTLLKLNKAGVGVDEMKTLFGEKAVKTFSGIFGKDMQTNVDILNKKMLKFDGSAKRMEKTMMKGLPGALARTKSAFEGMQIEFAEKSGLSAGFTKLLDKVSALISWFGNLSPTTLKIIAIFAGFIAVLGPLLVVIGGLLVALSMLPMLLGGVATALLIITSPVTFWIAAIAALIAVGFLLVKNWDVVVSYWGGLIKKLGGFFAGLWKKVPNGFKKMALNIVSVLFPVIGMFRLLMKYKDKLAGVAKFFLPKGLENKFGLSGGDDEPVVKSGLSNNKAGFEGVLRIENAPPGSAVTTTKGDMDIDVDTGIFPVGLAGA